MSMYNLLEYSGNYSMALGSLSNYYRDGINESAIETNNDGNQASNNKTTTR